jgi:hypothetical protein
MTTKTTTGTASDPRFNSADPIVDLETEALVAEVTRGKTRTITLTGRAPVQIREVEWPEIASATDTPGAMRNGTPVPNYETDTYTLRVRQHADGRAIVYGVVDAATAWTGTEDWRGGELVAAGDDVAAAIERVGGHMPERVIRECIADLPAEEI